MELIGSPRAARRLRVERAVIVHADADWLERIAEGRVDLFHKLEAKAATEGWPMLMVAQGSREAAELDRRPEDIRLICADAPGYAPRTLHLRPSYVWGFWHLDELGLRAHSSLRFGGFCADQVDPAKARYFFDGVSGFMLRENISGRPQEVRVHAPLQGARATVFCQEIEDRPGERLHYLTTEEMIRTCAEHDRDALIYVKLHPATSKPTRRAIMDITRDYPNVKLSEASVHDLIEASDLVVTQTSGVGFEALMQRCAVVTCGKVDYWQATLTARRVSDLREALSFGPEAMAEFPFEKYFYWYLGQRCLEPAKEGVETRAWARIRDKAMV
jgi:hypothetical protein